MNLQSSDCIQLRGLKVYSHVGVLAEEKAEGQYFYLDFYLYPGYSKASLSDRLEETVNYAEATYLIRDIAEKSKRDLIEALAGDLAEALLNAYPSLLAVRLDVHKPSAPIDADFTDVIFSLERRRRYPVKISLGSNMGERKAYLDFAIAKLSEHPEISHFRCSRFFESKAWGLEDQADFLNAVAAFETSLDPWSLLALLQSIEAEAGRVRKEKWGPRVLDIDIIHYGEYGSASKDLKIPHPYRMERNFVQVPLQELAEPTLEISENLKIYEEKEKAVMTPKTENKQRVKADSALLVVDCQHDFVEGSLACQHSHEAIDNIIQYINKNPEIFVAYSLDWHSMTNESFKRNGGIWPDHCVQNSQGAKLDSAFTEKIINPAQRPQADNCFYKGQDDKVEEYSAFNAKRADGAALHEILPEEVRVAGLASEYCVRESALALNAAGFNARVMPEAVGYVDKAEHLKNLQDLRERNLLFEE